MIELLLALAGAVHQDEPQWPDQLVLECQAETWSSVQRAESGWSFEGTPVDPEPFRMTILPAFRTAEGWSSNIDVRSVGFNFPFGTRLDEEGNPTSAFPGQFHILGSPGDREFLLVMTATGDSGATMQTGSCRRVE